MKNFSAYLTLNFVLNAVLFIKAIDQIRSMIKAQTIINYNYFRISKSTRINPENHGVLMLITRVGGLWWKVKEFAVWRALIGSPVMRLMMRYVCSSTPNPTQQPSHPPSHTSHRCSLIPYLPPSPLTIFALTQPYLHDASARRHTLFSLHFEGCAGAAVFAKVMITAWKYHR